MTRGTILVGALALAPLCTVQAQTVLPRPGDGQMMAGAIGKLPVYDATGAQIGDAQGVVMGYDGSVAAVVVGLGGFLGILERPVAVSFEHVTIGETDEGTRRIDLDLPLAALEVAPTFEKP